jgi:hypothetical protein
MMEAAKDRAGETWKAALEKQKTRGLWRVPKEADKK